MYVKSIGQKLHLCILYIFVFSLLFVVQKYTIGFIPGLKDLILFNKVHFYEMFFAANAIIIIKYFVKIELPPRYRRTLKGQ